GVPRPTIAYQFNEAMDGGAWRRGGLLVYQFEGSTVQGTFEYDAATLRGTFRPDAKLVPGGTYVVEFSEAADRAGNAPEGGAWSFTYLAKTSLSVTDTSVAATGGESVRLQFRAGNVPAGAPILLEELVDLGGDIFRWTTIRETTARGDGTLQSIRFTPERSGRYAL
ncbi:MAG: Ig-like domain-containing protein, partial [Candidatus Limnocylindrus sp.]